MTDKKPDDYEEKLALRNNWLKIFVVVTLTAVISVKLWQADFGQAFSGFDFSDLLALFLAIFSIGLAVLFYLKATDTSNVFYDNTYRFTKDVSEILGRVEAGFGERLRHLDEGYSGLKSAVEKIPFDRKKAQKEIEEEEEQLEKVERERNELIESLAQRARLEEAEKSKLFDRLKEQDRELSSARKELHFLRRRMVNAERADSDEIQHRFPLSIRRHLREFIFPRLDSDVLLEAPTRILNRQFSSIVAEMPRGLVETLRDFNIVDSDNDLTPLGIEALRSMYREEHA